MHPYTLWGPLCGYIGCMAGSFPSGLPFIKQHPGYSDHMCVSEDYIKKKKSLPGSLLHPSF